MSFHKSPPKRRSPLRRPAKPKTLPSPTKPLDPGERLQKALAGSGLGSRRHLEALIAQGRVSVNGRPATLGQRVHPTDRVLIDGRAARMASARETPRLLLYHKPAGEIVSRDDPRGRPSVFDRLPELNRARWIAVGRLDFNTSGLLLLTDSGELAHRLMHPSFGMQREYAVRIMGAFSDAQRALLLGGVKLDDGLACFDVLEEAGGTGVNRWFRVVLHEGRNREVRRLFEAVGITVSRLIRVSFGSIKLPRELRQGRYREATAQEVKKLMSVPTD